jgi:hypothetical protein
LGNKAAQSKKATKAGSAQKPKKRKSEAALSETEENPEKEETKGIERKIASPRTDFGKAIKESQMRPKYKLETSMETKSETDSINLGGAIEHAKAKNQKNNRSRQTCLTRADRETEKPIWLG